MSLRTRTKRAYYRVLAKQALQLRESEFWRYHKEGLNRLEETLNWPYLALQIGRELVWMAANPGMTIVGALRFWKKRTAVKRGVV